jgi:hypothetical protein
LRLGEHDFYTACGGFTITDGGAESVEARRDYAAVIEDEQIAGLQEGWEVGEKLVGKRA